MSSEISVLKNRIIENIIDPSFKKEEIEKIVTHQGCNINKPFQQATLERLTKRVAEEIIGNIGPFLERDEIAKEIYAKHPEFNVSTTFTPIIEARLKEICHLSSDIPVVERTLFSDLSKLANWFKSS